MRFRFTQSSAIIATPTQGQKDTKSMKDIHLQKLNTTIGVHNTIDGGEFIVFSSNADYYGVQVALFQPGSEGLFNKVRI